MDILTNKIIISTHHLVYGAPQALRDYLIKKKIPLLYISHPLFIDNTKSYFEIISNGKINRQINTAFRFKINLFNFFLDVILTLFWVIKTRKKYTLFIGVDSLNTLSGLILKKIGLIEKVIFYTIDYVPIRFENKVLNKIYHLIDRLCLTFADETWNVSPRIALGREKIRGLKQQTYNKQIVVPIGIWFNKVKRVSFEKIKKHQLFFLGHLMESAGVQMILKVIPKIIKEIPDFHFLVVGGGEYEVTLKKLAKKLKINNYVTFTGWIKNRETINNIMADSALAIALYDKKTSRNTYYADPTKLKDYLSASLPIILTNLPHNAYDIEKNKCGIVINYNEEEISSKIIFLMKNQNILKQYRNNAVNYVKKYDWNIIFNKTLSHLIT